jgi:hypothetical protein
MAGYLAALWAAVSSATDSTVRRSPDQIFRVEVLGEPAAKFQRLEEWCSRLEWFAARICDPLLGPPPGRPRCPTVWMRPLDSLGRRWLHDRWRMLNQRPCKLQLCEFRTSCWTTLMDRLLWQRPYPRWWSCSRARSMPRPLRGFARGSGLRWLHLVAFPRAEIRAGAARV